MKGLAKFALVPALALAAFAADPGPAPGSQIPSFSLPDQNGTKQTLSSLKGPKGTMLVFFRSADW